MAELSAPLRCALMYLKELRMRRLLSLVVLAVPGLGQVALTGHVSSVEEGRMEGVLVGAKKAGSTITITVVSDADGEYRFPSSKIGPGEYALRIRAV